MYTKKQKTLVLLTCAIFILAILFSALFIAKEAEHDCTGESCSVCACIYRAEQTLKQLVTGTAVATVNILIMAQLTPVLVCVFLAAPCITLISQKVRLND